MKLKAVHATIRDVARRAEVSVATVSRVLNGLDNVRPAMRERVEGAAAELGYVPHAGARSLSLARSHMIGVVLPDLYGEYYSEILRGVDRTATANGLNVLLSNIHGDEARGIEVVRTMRGRVDGLVLMLPDIDTDRVLAALPHSMPVVLVNCRDGEDLRSEIRIDNALGASRVVRHLLDQGYRQIVHLAGPAFNTEAQVRAEAYRAEINAHDGSAEPLVIEGDFREESGVQLAARILAGEVCTDAVFAANDMMAIGLMTALREGGVDVPGQIAVAGFDDIPLARFVTPGLTTARVDMYERGKQAVAMLSDAMERRAPRQIADCVPELIVRGSTPTKTT